MYFDYTQWHMAECDTGRDKILVYGSDGAVTWGDVYDRALTLKQHFESHGAGQSHPVVLYGHKQSSMVIGMVACMLGDIPFVPIDVMMPADRMATIVEKSGACVVWDCTTDTMTFPDNPTPIIPPIQTNEKMAYILFTSGSTGEPKGVCISQKNLACFAHWIGNDFGFCPDDVFLNQAVFSFDLSVTEIVSTLSFGATMVCLTSQDTPQTVIEKIQNHGVSVWISTPSYVRSFLLHDTFLGECCPSLTTFWFCGEALPIKTVQVLQKRFEKNTIHNNYGPTEATVAFTTVVMTQEWISRGLVPIGYSMPSGKVFIDGESETDQKDSEYGETEQGEIVLVGDSVALGYLNQPDLTAEKFYETTLNGMPTRAYRTGDMGTIKDGVVYYVGRADDQLKMHGFRIEIGDIEQCLHTIRGVDVGVVLPLKRGGQVARLVGLVKGDTSLSPHDIKQHLAQALPHYMVPSEIVFVSDFPLNLNGKIDKKALLSDYQQGKLTS